MVSFLLQHDWKKVALLYGIDKKTINIPVVKRIASLMKKNGITIIEEGSYPSPYFYQQTETGKDNKKYSPFTKFVHETYLKARSMSLKVLLLLLLLY